MSIRNQWIQGLQWGGGAWLVWVAGGAFLHASHCSLAPEPYFFVSVASLAQRSALAAVWIAALALTWTRWSRAGVAVAVVVQGVLGTIEAARYPGEMHLGWALTFWLPMSLPVLPLLFMEPERPRLTLALLAVGRWRDAIAQLSGWRWLGVAAAVVLLNRAGWVILVGYWGYGWVLIPALLFTLAAIPCRRKSSTA
jgi:hypothetical protein